MRRHDLWAAVFLLLFGVLASVETRKLTIGELGRPGPGFFPFFLAAVLSIVSLALLFQSLRIKSAKETTHRTEARQWGKVAWTLFGLVVYAFVLESLGFLLSTFFLMLFLFRAVDPLRWPVAIAGALTTSFLTYAIFKLWLQIPFPSGPWGV